MKSLGEVLRVPVIASVAICWILVRLQRNVTEPEYLECPSCIFGGVYHASMPYVIFGSATAMCSCLMSLILTPVEGFVNLRYCSIHLVALVVAHCACSFQFSCESINIPRYL